ncbi:hypothetical protein DFQ30_006581, partial [Apophysomyces sp. BC1015]
MSSALMKFSVLRFQLTPSSRSMAVALRSYTNTATTTMADTNQEQVEMHHHQVVPLTHDTIYSPQGLTSDSSAAPFSPTVNAVFD